MLPNPKPHPFAIFPCAPRRMRACLVHEWQHLLETRHFATWTSSHCSGRGRTHRCRGEDTDCVPNTISARTCGQSKLERGTNLCHLIRELPRRKDVPVEILTPLPRFCNAVVANMNALKMLCGTSPLAKPSAATVRRKRPSRSREHSQHFVRTTSNSRRSQTWQTATGSTVVVF